ncbi:hypothetical protein [Amycolatopsis alba]|nr:hypothetical protein [Amycolatopsis alba]
MNKDNAGKKSQSPKQPISKTGGKPQDRGQMDKNKSTPPVKGGDVD